MHFCNSRLAQIFSHFCVLLFWFFLLFAFYLHTCGASWFFLLKFWMNSTSPWTTSLTASITLSSSSQDGAGASAQPSTTRRHQERCALFRAAPPIPRGYASPNWSTWVVVYVGQELQVGSKACEVCRVSRPLQNDCQLLDAFGEGLWGLQLRPKTQAVKTNALKTRESLGFGCRVVLIPCRLWTACGTCGPDLRTAETTTAPARFAGRPPWRCGRSGRRVLSSVPRTCGTLLSAASGRSPRRASSPDERGGKKICHL